MRAFSFNRFAALLRKEWLQMKRDPITLRFIIALPMMQLFLFGYAINPDPKNLPAGLLSVEHPKYERTIITALRNTGYYKISMLRRRPRPNAGWREASIYSSSIFPLTSTAPSTAVITYQELANALVKEFMCSRIRLGGAFIRNPETHSAFRRNRLI